MRTSFHEILSRSPAKFLPKIEARPPHLDPLAVAVAAKKSSWFVYLLRCANGSLYTGITTDVPKRLAVHNSGKGSAYVRAHRPATLVAFTHSEDRSGASKLEYLIKSQSQKKKLLLAKTWQRTLPP